MIDKTMLVHIDVVPLSREPLGNAAWNGLALRAAWREIGPARLLGLANFSDNVLLVQHQCLMGINATAESRSVAARLGCGPTPVPAACSPIYPRRHASPV